MRVVVILGLLGVGAVLLFPVAVRKYHAGLFEECRLELQDLGSQKPTVAHVESELGQEPFRIAKSPDATTVAHIWTNSLNPFAEIETKVRSWPETRIYLKSPMIYFIHFDSEGTMRDFSCAEN